MTFKQNEKLAVTQCLSLIEDLSSSFVTYQVISLNDSFQKSITALAIMREIAILIQIAKSRETPTKYGNNYH